MPTPLAAQAALRRTASPEHVAAAITQVQLRQRAAEKFGDLAERMYFTPEGLEQATRLPVATHRAARLRAAGHRDPDRPRLRHRRRPGRLRPRRDHLCRRRPRPACGSRSPRPTSRRSASGAPSPSRTRPRSTPPPSTWPSPTRRAGRRGGAASTSTTGPRRGRFVQTLLGRDSCVKVAPGHPARPGARGRRGRVGQRPPRGQGGGALVGPAGHHPPPGHGHRRRRPGDPDRRGRPRRRAPGRWPRSSTSPTAR